MSSPNILIRNQAAEQFISEIVNIWARDRPQDAAAFKSLLQREKETLVTSSGMSRDGQFAYRGQIPTDLYIVIEGKFPGFLKDPKNLIMTHRIVMGDYRPKADKDFFYINRSEDAAPKADLPT